MIDILREDYKVNGLRLEKLWIVTIYRIGNKVYYSTLPKVLKKFILIILNIIRKVFVVLLFKVEIPFSCKVGKGFKLMHPNGIILHKNVIIGEYCTLYHQVTIGSNDKGDVNKVANIGNNVYIGSGAKLIGNIVIGDNSKIGANAVVINNVPKNSVAVGVPAKVKEQKGVI
ncbi:hypothetical protein GCM10008916_02850 [Clostridium nitritogenes]|uniref:Serine acetyltransferase n=1 Tax=Clostridium nitritogenes TaxID=83340 RepID=A0ABN1LGP5_9CLOT